MKRSETTPVCAFGKPVFDLVITLLLWTYYILGFVILFAPFYLWAYLFSSNREQSFQKLTHRFFKGFFFLVRSLIPWSKWRISEDVLKIRSSVIVCNHISYLDSILLISLFERSKTIAKSRFFNIPFLKQVIVFSGYIPSTYEGELSGLMIERIEQMGDYLVAGGNFFVFPEGTRSRDGAIGRFNKGAFKIARLCKKPIKVLFVRNTDKLFRPGTFLFNTCVANTITVDLLASIEPDYQSGTGSTPELMRQVRSLLEEQQAKPAA
jgi:1-acyl-sn-glycerol-3-phosphate acyltransferase